MKIKDRVKQKAGNRNTVGTIVKIYKGKGKGKSVKTCVVLWDYDWPRHEFDRRYGKVYYFKPDDLEVVDTWSLD